MKCLIIFLALASSTSALVLPCTAERGAFPKSVTIEDCDENEKRCAFTRGKNLKVDVEFTAVSDIKTMIPQVNVTVGAVKLEAPLPSDRYEACNWLLEDAQPCPIPRGKVTTWRLNLPLEMTTMLVPVKLEVSLFAEDGKPQFCFILLAKIVAF